MSTRQRYNRPYTYSSRSRPTISGGTILFLFCFAKCVYDVVKENRQRHQPVYQTGTTDSELSFEPYIPRRERRSRRHHRGRREWSTSRNRSVDTLQREDWTASYVMNAPSTRAQSHARERCSIRADSRRNPSLASLDCEIPGGLECQICFDVKPEEEFPSRRMTKKCKHDATDCCSECLNHSISTAFEGNMWDDIRCPICNEQLQFQDMAELAPPSVFERYDAFYLRRALEQDLPYFRWCVSRHCSYGEEYPEDPSPVIACSACGTLACSHHNVPWHHEETCSEYDRRIAARQARAEYKSEKAIRRVAKRCPGCMRFINKNGGCNHMTCLCGRQFCWTCLHDHPGHHQTCPHHLG